MKLCSNHWTLEIQLKKSRKLYKSGNRFQFRGFHFLVEFDCNHVLSSNGLSSSISLSIMVRIEPSSLEYLVLNQPLYKLAPILVNRRAEIEFSNTDFSVICLFLPHLIMDIFRYCTVDKRQFWLECVVCL